MPVFLNVFLILVPVFLILVPVFFYPRACFFDAGTVQQLAVRPDRGTRDEPRSRTVAPSDRKVLAPAPGVVNWSCEASVLRHCLALKQPRVNGIYAAPRSRQ